MGVKAEFNDSLLWKQKSEPLGLDCEMEPQDSTLSSGPSGPVAEDLCPVPRRAPPQRRPPGPSPCGQQLPRPLWGGGRPLCRHKPAGPLSREGAEGCGKGWCVTLFIF